MAIPTPADRSRSRRVSPSRLDLTHRPGVPLPASPTSFVGREREIALLTSLLRRDGVRFVTLTGPGGVGKTRLALRVAQALSPGRVDGAAFVSLAAVSDPDLVVATTAQTLGVPDAGDRSLSDQVIRVLNAREMLLIFDNFEHLIPATQFITDVLNACPRLVVLVRSQTR